MCIQVPARWADNMTQLQVRMISSSRFSIKPPIQRTVTIPSFKRRSGRNGNGCRKKSEPSLVRAHGRSGLQWKPQDASGCHELHASGCRKAQRWGAILGWCLCVWPCWLQVWDIYPLSSLELHPKYEHNICLLALAFVKESHFQYRWVMALLRRWWRRGFQTHRVFSLDIARRTAIQHEGGSCGKPTWSGNGKPTAIHPY